MPIGSKIFIPNRALGYVSNHIPLQVRYIKSRKENLITTCVGKSFHTYGISHFTLLSVSTLHTDDITCMSSDTYHIYTACENVVFAWRRGTELKHSYRGHTKNVHLLLPFGVHLLSVDESSVVKIWDIKTEELFSELMFSNEDFKITTILHPNTYMNKILLGSEQGSMQLWNIKTMKLIYKFEGWKSAISCLEHAPAIDVIAIGLSNGKIILHNLKYDETIIEFSQDWGYVTTISFRTDGFSIMATGSVTGHIVFWDLENHRIHSQLMSAHYGPVTGMQFMSNEPLLVTSSPDNTLKLWIFDTTDGGARLLRLREGHSANPSFIRFHGANGHNLLSSAGDSTLRIFNTQTETFNKSFGLASYNRKVSKKRGRGVEDPLKMPPIINFTTETTREKEWDNIAAVHLGIATVTMWSYDKVKMSEIKLLPERFRKKKIDLDLHVAATCLSLTHCGNFVLVGYSTGHVDKFNVQSGFWRETYGSPKAHDGPVRGIATDSLNNVVVTAASDCILKFWFFKCKDTSPIQKIIIDESVAFINSHRDSEMVAIALENFNIEILDLDTRRIIRKFIGHTAQITDATFSPDSRWLITASMDNTIKTWDIPSGQLIDHFRMDSACTSLSFSPTGEFLATAHVDCLGVFLWANRTLYSHVTLKALSKDSEATLIKLPDCANEEEYSEGEEEIEIKHESPEQINNNLITLSNLANSRWQNLLNIDIIKKRNKPKAPPKAPKSAPFFLPTVQSLNFQFDFNNLEKTQSDTKIVQKNLFVNLSNFGKQLQQSVSTSDYIPIINTLKLLGPSMIDFEVKSLSPEEGGTIEIMHEYMKCIQYMFSENKNFELAQAYLAVFLKHHGKVIANNKELRDYMPVIQNSQSTSWLKLQDKLFYCLCVTKNLKTM